MKKKLILLSLAMLLVIAAAVGTTFAYLTDKDTARNTFTVGKVMIDLTETTGKSYQMVPGCEIDKDPTVTVKKGSEKCWVFVKVEESQNPELAKFLKYQVDENWTQLMDGNTKVPGVYYRIAEKSDDKQTFPVLKDNQVTVLDTVTKFDMAGISAVQPTLKISAYACQYEGFYDPEKTDAGNAFAAWKEVNK